MANIGHIVHKFIVGGLKLRCPSCEQGKMFDGFNLRETCEVCGVRFERREGESVGGVMINLVVVEVLFVVGFFTVDALTDIPPMNQLPFWVPFAILFPILFYRSSRGLWVTTAYLNGDLDKDKPAE
jgi:uncharacterized protein (DUF983 family)